MIKLNRREMLRSMVLGSGMATFGGISTLGSLQSAYAKPESSAIPDRYYIFCYFSGAWDILMSLDPRDPSVFRHDNKAITRIQPAYDVLGYVNDPRLHDIKMGQGKSMIDTTTGKPAHFGPAFAPMLMDQDITSRLAVIRGMSMDTLTHEVGRRRFLTGKQPAGLAARGSSTDTWMAAKLAGKEPIPNLAMRMESYNKDQPNFASAMRTNNSDDLLRVLSPGDVQLDLKQERQLDDLLRQHSLCADTQLSPMLQQAEEARQKTSDMLSRGLDRLFDFKARTDGMERMRDAFNITSRTASGDPEVQAATAAVALTKRVSRCVSIEVARGLDTHFVNWSQTQQPTQERGFNSVYRLAKYLLNTPYIDTNGKEDGNWLDKTVIVGFSEFSRTPLLNGNEGRDHWLGNSSFMLGGGIQGGRTYGRSSDFGMYPTKVNLKTGLPDEGGEVIRPEHLLQALYDEVEIGDEPDLRVKGFEALLKG